MGSPLRGDASPGDGMRVVLPPVRLLPESHHGFGLDSKDEVSESTTSPLDPSIKKDTSMPFFSKDMMV